MRGQIYIPDEVKEAIKKHLVSAIEKAKDSFSSAYEDEDVLTGVLFGLMRNNEESVEVNDPEMGGTWKWSVDFSKFGGRGKGATESILGADGIIELNVSRSGRTESKSLLFQSKLEWNGKDPSLYMQSLKLLNWLGAATIINYTEEEFETYRVENVFSKGGQKPAEGDTLTNTLCEEFLNCDIGDADLHYDAFRKKLIWVDEKYETISTQFNINRRLKIKVKAPNKFPYEKLKIDKDIPNADIMNHKLNNEYSTFNVTETSNDRELKKKQRAISSIFHPDKHPSLPDKEKNMLNDLMQQYNHQFDLQKEVIKKKK